MAQPTPEKILAIIDDHDRAQKKQRNKNVFIYLCLCLAIIATFRLDGVAVLTILLGVSAIAFFLHYVESGKGQILSSDRILSILAQTKDYPTIRRKVVNRLLSGSKLTGKDEEYIFSELKKAEQSNEREKRLQAIKEYTS
ncbi:MULTISPECIES: hypothetical protein [Enterobacteriaceae]|jgi:hypothetical protein|uniref:Protein YafA n=2 Tax=Escherichia coli TaxID=562 RepID=A0AAF0HRX0_ECOLX|nr:MULTISPECIES: hypothetical protein [Enterobacteriaceae]MED6773520.1 hypothetical protein [Escherichia coli O157]UOH96389.1 hypothetical protein DI251_22895 [Salmonella enterica subsp. enterica serovar Reading]EIL25744.1 hypothetical protein ECO9545_12415 [Escherichia coli O111:H11 str. CVM9545]EOU84858.1 hypothetical protein WG5_05465 [Escherichia coli KTE37]EOU97665.1 hypothetical protein WG7_05311 [Escherichia coli KTE38]